MPFTFFAHQAFVVPLKLARPRAFDGTALCIGSMAPDLAYAFVGTPLQFNSHTWQAQLLWTVPISLAITRLIRDSIADPVGAHLPAPLGPEVRALSLSRHSLRTSVLSALVGGLSHVFVDGFTHWDGWAARRIEWLRHGFVFESGHYLSMSRLLQYLGHTLGTAIGFAMLAYLVARHCVTRWNLPARVPAAQPVVPRFWFPFVLSAFVSLPLGLASVAALGGGLSPALIRAACVAFAGLWLSARAAVDPRLPGERASS